MSWFTEFDPNPTWLFTILHTISIFAGMVYLCGVFCVLFVKQEKTDNRYRLLLLTGMTINFLGQFNITTGSLPIVAFPPPAGYAAGFLSDFGVPTCAQLALNLDLMILGGACTTLLFFYRHHILLPFPKRVTWAYLALVFIGIVVIPPPFTASLCFTNRTMYKIKACEETPVECERMKEFLSDPRVDVLYFSELNLPSSIGIYLFLLGTAMVISISVFVWRLIFQLKSKMISEATRKIHKVLVNSLLALTLVQYAFFLIPGIGILACVILSLPGPGMVQIAEICYSLSDPAGVIAMIWWRKDYKSAIISFLRRGLWCKKFNKRSSIDSSTNKSHGNFTRRTTLDRPKLSVGRKSFAEPEPKMERRNTNAMVFTKRPSTLL